MCSIAINCYVLNKLISERQETPIAMGFFQIFFQIGVASIEANENNFERFAAQFFVEILKEAKIYTKN